MILVVLIIVIIFLIIIVRVNKKPEKKTSPVTRQTIEYNLKDYPNEYVFNVKGVHLEHYLYAVLNCCKVHDIVTLVPEPNNTYDSNAVKVECSGWQIGYVPQYETDEVYDILKKDYIAYVEKCETAGYIKVSVRIKYK